MRGVGRILRQAGAAEPEDLAVLHGLLGQIGSLDLQVRSRRLTVEEEWRVGNQLTEGHRRVQVRISDDEFIADAQTTHFVANVLSEWIVAHTCQDCRIFTQFCRCHRDIHGRSAEELLERLYLIKGRVHLKGVNIHATAANG